MWKYVEQKLGYPTPLDSGLPKDVVFSFLLKQIKDRVWEPPQLRMQ